MWHFTFYEIGNAGVYLCAGLPGVPSRDILSLLKVGKSNLWKFGTFQLVYIRSLYVLKLLCMAEKGECMYVFDVAATASTRDEGKDELSALQRVEATGSCGFGNDIC